MAAENILGKLIIEGANRAGGIAGGAPSLGSGLAGGGGGTRSAEQETRGFQKTVKDAQVKAVGFAKEQPKWWTRMFKTLGIQMGLAGILKQSQVFTSTIGAMFQIFGAMVDVMLVPLVKPVLMPVMRWLARQIPTMGRLSKAIFGFIGSTIMGVIRWVKKIGGWTEDIWGWMKNVGSATWWKQSVFSPITGAINAIPGLLKTAFSNMISPSWWINNVFRPIWNSTLGGFCFTIMKKRICIPTWAGSGGSFDIEGAGTKSETLVTKDAEGNVLSYEQTKGGMGTIESAFKTGLDKEGKVLQEKYGVNNDRTGDVLLGIWEWMKGGTGRTLAGYEKYKESWLGGRAKDREKDMGEGLMDKIQEAPGAMKEMFDELGTIMKGAALAVGGSAALVAGLKIKNLTTAAVGKVMQVGLAPGKVALGIIRLVAQQINPTSTEAFVGQIARGVPKGSALGKALGAWKGNLLKDLGFKPPAIAPTVGSGNSWVNAGDEALDLGADVTRANKMFPLTGPDAVDGTTKNSSILSRARQLVKNLTSYVLRQLRNIGGILKNPTLVRSVRNTLTRMTDEIEALLRPIANSVPEAQGLVAATRVSKNFLLRSLPLVGAAVGIAETAYNIQAIARSDLSWIKPKESEQLTRDIERMKKSLGMSEDLMAESAAYGYGPGDWFGIKKWMTSKAGTDVAETGLYQGAGTVGMNTKTGAILTQLLLGTGATAAGALGVAGLPISLSLAAAQEVHRMGTLNNNDTILQGLADAFNQGVLNKDKAIKLQVDGLDAVMDIPGF